LASVAENTGLIACNHKWPNGVHIINGIMNTHHEPNSCNFARLLPLWQVTREIQLDFSA